MVSTGNMTNLVQDIISSYELRISAVGIIIDNTYQIIEDFKNQTNVVCEQLRGNLAKGKSLRKKDFDNMMKDVLTCQENREKEIRDSLKAFLVEQRNMAETIKEGLLKEDEGGRLNIFKNMLQNFKTREASREDEIIMKLKEFHRGYKEMFESMRSLLNKGEVIQIKDFKEMLRNIRSSHVRNEFLNGSRQAWVREEKGGDRAIEREEVVMV